MKMVIRFVTMSLVLATLACQREKPLPMLSDEEIVISYERMEFEEPYSEEASFYSIRDIEVDKNGNIYIADDASLLVRVFDTQGKKLTEIGLRGRGPGELISIKGFGLDEQRGSVFIFDRYQMRITEFGLDGSYKETYNMKDINSSVRFLKTTHGQVLIHANPNPLKEVGMGHIYDENFELESSFMTIEEIDDGIEEVVGEIRALHGSLLVHNDDIYFAPTIFSGIIYEYTYSKEIETYEQTRKIEAGHTDEIYTILKNDRGRKFDIRSQGPDVPGGDMMLLVQSRSRGLVQYDGFFYHLILRDIEEERVLGLEVYDENWNFIGFKKLKSIPITNEPLNTIIWNIMGIDKEGTVYVREGTKDASGYNVLKMTIENKLQTEAK